MKETVESIRQLLAAPKNIVMIGHTNPDGDAVGAAIAMTFFLRKEGHCCRIILPDALDYSLSWLPEVPNIIIYKNQQEEAKSVIANAQIFFCLDFNNIGRMGEMNEIVLQRTDSVKILIDHHLNPVFDNFDICISTPNVSSTSELVFQFIKIYSGEKMIDATIATALYVGIITDTGSLSFSCNNASVYHALATLIETGIDIQYIRSRLYNMQPISRLRLIGFSLYRQLKINKTLRIAYIVLPQHELKQLHYQKGDTEGIVNFCISIQNIVFGCIIIEHPDRIQLSFRSRGDFDVNRIAETHFNGGGHKNAAGGNCSLPLEDTVKLFESVIKEYKQELLSVKI